MSEEKSTPRQEEKFFVEVKGFIFEESTPARKIAYIDAQYDRASGEWLLGGVLLRYGDLIAFNQGKYVVFSREHHEFRVEAFDGSTKKRGGTKPGLMPGEPILGPLINGVRMIQIDPNEE